MLDVLGEHGLQMAAAEDECPVEDECPASALGVSRRVTPAGPPTEFVHCDHRTRWLLPRG